MTLDLETPRTMIAEARRPTGHRARRRPGPLLRRRSDRRRRGTGDTSDNDEAAAVAGIVSAGLTAETG